MGAEKKEKRRKLLPLIPVQAVYPVLALCLLVLLLAMVIMHSLLLLPGVFVLCALYFAALAFGHRRQYNEKKYSWKLFWFLGVVLFSLVLAHFSAVYLW